MSPDPNAAKRVDRARCRHMPVAALWSLAHDDSDFPARLLKNPRTADFRALYGIGNRDIMWRHCLGLICSVQCPGSVVIKTFDAIRELRDAGIVVAGGFHSPMERDCLDFLLRGEQPVIICPARHPPQGRLPASWRTALDAGRLLIVSPFDKSVRRTTTAHAQSRNEFVAALSAALLIPHASAGGKAEATARQILGSNQPLFTFDDEENFEVVKAGAKTYRVERISQILNREDRHDPVT